MSQGYLNTETRNRGICIVEGPRMGMVFRKLLDENLSVQDDSGVEISVEKKLILSFACEFQDGKWLYRQFQQFVLDNIVDTALNQRERAALSGRHHSALVEAAKNLRLTDKSDDIGSGSELAEAVLYGVMRHHYGALPVVPKIFYKQNSKDNAKGADSVHITVVEDDFHLWIGEAKFYNSIDSARLASVIKSVGESLRSDKLSKENSLICNLGELDACVDNPEMVQRIKSALSPDATMDSIKPRLHVPILLLHECSITAATKSWSTDYEVEIIAFHRDRARDYFIRQLKALEAEVFKYEEIAFHVILIPVPSKAEVVERFLGSVEYYKEEGR